MRRIVRASAAVTVLLMAMSTTLDAQVEPLSADNSQRVTIRAAVDTATPRSVVVTLVSTASDCRLPALFDAPTYLGTAVQLKRMERVNRVSQADGTCVETIVAKYSLSEFHYLAAASTVAMELPSGLLTWRSGLPESVRSVAPAGSGPFVIKPDDFRDLGQLNALIASGRASEARTRAETMAPLFVTRPPLETAEFYATLGLARRMTGDLAGAAVCYQLAWKVMFATDKSSERAGVIADGLSVVRRLQKDFEAATDESDRALLILTRFATRSYGVALSNRAWLLADRGNFAGAVDYSDRALVVLKEVLKSEPAALAPYLDDNSRFKTARDR